MATSSTILDSFTACVTGLTTSRPAPFITRTRIPTHFFLTPNLIHLFRFPPRTWRHEWKKGCPFSPMDFARPKPPRFLLIACPRKETREPNFPPPVQVYKQGIGQQRIPCGLPC